MIRQTYTPPKYLIPAEACDCHMHIFGPRDVYPPSPKRTYTPRPAPIELYKKMALSLNLKRVVVVQASAYGSDNRCLLDSIKEFGPMAKGIAGIDENTSNKMLHAMDKQGVCGIRINAASKNLKDTNTIKESILKAVKQIEPLGWHVQLFVDLEVIDNLADFFSTLPVPVVFDHMGLTPTHMNKYSKEFQRFLNLIAGDNCWVKLAGADRISMNDIEGFDDALPVMKSFISANPERVIWGTDWPHTGRHGHATISEPPLIEYRNVDTAILLDLLVEAAENPSTIKQILVDNPMNLYGFQ